MKLVATFDVPGSDSTLKIFSLEDSQLLYKESNFQKRIITITMKTYNGLCHSVSEC